MKKLTILMYSALLIFAVQNLTAQDTIAQPSDNLMNVEVFPKVGDTLPKTITITAVGDIMLGSIVPDKSYCPPNMDASHLLDEVRPYFDSSDVVFCNVEGTFTDTKLGAKNCHDPKTCFTFGMPRKFANCFKDTDSTL